MILALLAGESLKGHTVVNDENEDININGKCHLFVSIGKYEGFSVAAEHSMYGEGRCPCL